MSKTKKNKIKKNLTIKQRNKPLEKFWNNLASGKNVVLIYKDGSYKIKKLENTTKRKKEQYLKWDEDSSIVAILSSSMSSDAYTMYLYPKAKNKSVKEVIKNYKHYFKNDEPTPKYLVEQGWKWDKVLDPY